MRPSAVPAIAVVVSAILIMLFEAALPAVSTAGTGGRSVESATWRFEFDNDLFFHKDNKLTNVWSLHRYSDIAQNRDDIKYTPGALKGILKKLPGFTNEGLVFRSGLGIGQIMQTPSDSTRTDLIINDVPYAGAITAHGTWFAFNNKEFYGLEIICGLMGPLSMAEQTQKTAHKIFDSVDPKGWDNQLKTEPLLNINYMVKRKILSLGSPGGFSMDTAIGGNMGIGNLFTQASVSVDIRIGHNMTRGFFYVPDPAGVFMNYLASLKPQNPAYGSLYAGLSIRGTAFVRNELLDGNLFRNSHSVDKKPFVGSIAWGLYYEGKRLGVTLAAIVCTDDVDTSKATAAEGDERLGIISLEWRF